MVVPKHRRTGEERNRLKSRLREALRNAILPALDASGLRLDVIVRARREAYDVAGYGELVAELTQWLERRCSHVR